MSEQQEASAELQEEVDPSLVLRLRQLGDNGLCRVMQILSKDE